MQRQPLLASTREAFIAVTLVALLIPAALFFIVAGEREDTRCNDACAALRHEGVIAGKPWYRSADSWQWGFQYWLVVGCLISLVVAFGLAARGRWRVAIPLALCAVAAQVVWLVGFYLPVP